MKSRTKHYSIILAFLVALIAYPNLKLNAYMYESDEWTAREFFQIIEDFDDGSRNRYTGCVTLGGSCWSQGPEVDQDCWSDGVWSPCGWE